MELHVVAVRNLKEKKIDAFTNNHNFDTFFHFHCSQLLKPKLVRRNYESACLVRHHHCIYFYFVIFLIFEMEILQKCSPAENFWCSSLVGHSSLTFVMRWLLWSSFTVTKDGCRQLFVEHYPLSTRVCLRATVDSPLSWGDFYITLPSWCTASKARHPEAWDQSLQSDVTLL